FSRDWSSDVCSSDLDLFEAFRQLACDRHLPRAAAYSQKITHRGLHTVRRFKHEHRRRAGTPLLQPLASRPALVGRKPRKDEGGVDRKSTRLNSSHVK